MSLPISQAGTILGAARAVRDVAGNIAGQIADAVSFDEVLSEQAGSESDADTQPSLLDQTVAAIQSRLSQVGITANPPIELTVLADGTLRVSGNHDQAAEIERILSADGELLDLAGRLYADTGTTRMTIGTDENHSDLTRNGAQGTMAGRPGGYANWLAG